MSEATFCPSCEGWGFDVFAVDREPGLEVERCDECGRYADDDEARLMFVACLERGVSWAKRCAFELTGGVSDILSPGQHLADCGCTRCLMEVASKLAREKQAEAVRDWAEGS